MPSFNIFNGRGIWIEDKDKLLYQLSLESYLSGKKNDTLNWQAYLQKDLDPSQIAYMRTLGSHYEGAETALVAAYVSGQLNNIQQILIVDTDKGDEEMELFSKRGYKLIYDCRQLKQILDATTNKETPESLTRKLHLCHDSGMVSHKQLQISEISSLYDVTERYTVIDYIGNIPDELIEEMINIGLNSVSKLWSIEQSLKTIVRNCLISDLDLETREANQDPLLFFYALGIASTRETYFNMKRTANKTPSALASALYWHSSLLFHMKDKPQFQQQLDMLRSLNDKIDISLEIMHREFHETLTDYFETFSANVCEIWSHAAEEIHSEGFYTNPDDIEYCANIRAIAKVLNLDQLFEAYDEGVPVESLLA